MYHTDQTVRHSSHAAPESYESFNDRYASFFANAQDLFELQRGLNNCFAYDLVPSQKGLLHHLVIPALPRPPVVCNRCFVHR